MKNERKHVRWERRGGSEGRKDRRKEGRKEGRKEETYMHKEMIHKIITFWLPWQYVPLDKAIHFSAL